MTNTTNPPSGSRSPATPASSVSSVRAIVSWLEKSGGSEKETNKTAGGVREKITTGRIAADHVHALSPTNRPQGVQRPALVVKNVPPIIKSTEQTKSQTLEKAPKTLEKAPEEAPEKALEKVQEKAQTKVTEKATEKVLEKTPVKALEQVFEKISVKTPTKAVSPRKPFSPSIPFSPTRTLFPRNTSPVRRTNASTTSLLTINNNGPTSTPTTPCWRHRHFDDDHGDRSALVCVSPSLLAMPTTPAALKTPMTPIRAAANYNETPEDYSLTLLRYKAYFERPLARCLDEEGGQAAEGDAHKGDRTDDRAGVHATVVDKQKSYDSTPRRQKKDVDAFWAPVRQYLLITDEELYES